AWECDRQRGTHSLPPSSAWFKAGFQGHAVSVQVSVQIGHTPSEVGTSLATILNQATFSGLVQTGVQGGRTAFPGRRGLCRRPGKAVLHPGYPTMPRFEPCQLLGPWQAVKS